MSLSGVIRREIRILFQFFFSLIQVHFRVFRKQCVVLPYCYMTKSLEQLSKYIFTYLLVVPTKIILKINF